MDLPQCMACAIAGETGGGLDQVAAGLHFALGLPTGHSGSSNDDLVRRVATPKADETGCTQVSSPRSHLKRPR